MPDGPKKQFDLPVRLTAGSEELLMIRNEYIGLIDFTIEVNHAVQEYRSIMRGKYLLAKPAALIV